MVVVVLVGVDEKEAIMECVGFVARGTSYVGLTIRVDVDVFEELEHSCLGHNLFVFFVLVSRPYFFKFLAVRGR